MRNLDLTSLRSFVAVVESGGVTRAAQAVNKSQSAVSMQLKRLEDLLGVALHERRGRQLVLTEAGDQLLVCLLYTSPSPRDGLLSRMPSSA